MKKKRKKRKARVKNVCWELRLEKLTSIITHPLYCTIYIYTEWGFNIKCRCGLLEITRWLWLCVDMYYTPQFLYVSKYISCCWYYSRVNCWIVWIGILLVYDCYIICLWLVYYWYMIGLWLVYDWFMIGILLVYDWFMIGIYLVYVEYIFGICGVYIWYMLSIYMVYVKYIFCGICICHGYKL